MMKILSQKQLDRLIEKNPDRSLECFILLNYNLRSSKSITFDGDNYYIYNEIDDTEDIVKHDKLMDSFPIGDAIKKGALYAY